MPTSWTLAAPVWMEPVCPAPGGSHTGPNPTDRGKLGSKRHLITDRQGLPLMFCVNGANRHDSVVFEALVDALPAVGGKQGRPRRWPAKLHADKRGTTLPGAARTSSAAVFRIALPAEVLSAMTGSGAIAGWSSARTPGWLAVFGKLRTRFERCIDVHVALLSLACCVICVRRLLPFC